MHIPTNSRCKHSEWQRVAQEWQRIAQEWQRKNLWHGVRMEVFESGMVVKYNNSIE